MAEEIKNMELNSEELYAVSGGCNSYSGVSEQPGYVFGLLSGYLAVRSNPREGTDNILGGLVNGARITLLNKYENGYALIRGYCGKTEWTNETGWQTGWANVKYICPSV